MIVLDEEAAYLLTYRDHYKWVEQNKLDWQQYPHSRRTKSAWGLVGEGGSLIEPEVKLVFCPRLVRC